MLGNRLVWFMYILAALDSLLASDLTHHGHSRSRHSSLKSGHKRRSVSVELEATDGQYPEILSKENGQWSAQVPVDEIPPQNPHHRHHKQENKHQSKMFRISHKNPPNSPVFTVSKGHRSNHRGSSKMLEFSRTGSTKNNHTSHMGSKRKREHGEQSRNQTHHHHSRTSNLALEASSNFAMFYQSDSSSWDNDGERFRESEVKSEVSSATPNTTLATEMPSTEAITMSARNTSVPRHNRLVNSSSADFRQYDELGGEAEVPGLFSPSGLYDDAPDEEERTPLDTTGIDLTDREELGGIPEWSHELIDDEQMQFDETSRNNRLNLMKGRDVVTRFLQIVESQHLLGANCTAGTALNLGEGVVDRYAQDRFRIEAEVAVNRANMLTR